jgi:hypothetical protein
MEFIDKTKGEVDKDEQLTDITQMPYPEIVRQQKEIYEDTYGLINKSIADGKHPLTVIPGVMAAVLRHNVELIRQIGVSDYEISNIPETIGKLLMVYVHYARLSGMNPEAAFNKLFSEATANKPGMTVRGL